MRSVITDATQSRERRRIDNGSRMRNRRRQVYVYLKGALAQTRHQIRKVEEIKARNG